MRDGWRLVQLGEVAHLDIVKVPVASGTTYQIAGVLNAGQGMLRRAPIDGSDTNYPALHRLRAGQLVMRKLTAWEGPITIVPEEYDGYVVSTEFPTFSLDTAVLLPGFMQLICQQPQFWEQMRSASTGTVQRRKRVNPSQLLAIQILLPPLAEQRRVIDLLASIDDAVEQAMRVRASAETSWRALADDLIGTAERRRPLSEGVAVTMGRQRSPQHAVGDHMVPYLRAANVKDGRLLLDDVLEMNFSPREQDTFRLVMGDVLVTEGCGSLEQLGASAVWREDKDGTVCFQNTLLRLRALEGATDPGYVHHLARYAHRAGWWATLASGTNIFHIGSERAKAMPAPLPPLDEQRSASTLLDAADELTRRAEDEYDALRESRDRILSELLSGAHQVPAGYDELLERAS